MAIDPSEVQQQAWVEETLLLLRELLPLMSPVGRYQYRAKEHAHSIGALASACARSSESVVLLCAYPVMGCRGSFSLRLRGHLEVHVFAASS